LTHNPRVEDWPVMPIEKHEIHLRPADFFEFNPALDVPGNKNNASVLVDDCCGTASNGGTNGHANGEVQGQPTTHMQGTGTVRVNGQ
jgi:primary-amine oxidase